MITLSDTELAYILHLLGKYYAITEVRTVMRLLVNLLPLEKGESDGLQNLSPNTSLAEDKSQDAQHA